MLLPSLIRIWHFSRSLAVESFSNQQCMCSLPATSEHTTKCTSAAAAVYISPQSGSKLPFSPFTRQPLPSAGEPPKCGTQKIARARSICLCLGSSNSSSLTPLPTTASGLVRMMGKAATVHARGPLVAATLFLPLTAALHYFQCFQCALPEIELSPPPHGRPLPCPVLSLLRGKRKAIEDAVAEEHSAEHCGILQSKLNAEIGGLLALALGSLCCTLFFSFSCSCSCSCSVIATVASSSVIGKTNLPTAKNCCCFIGGEC